MNNLYITPILRIHVIESAGMLCQSNGAKFNPTQELSGITWEDDE